MGMMRRQARRGGLVTAAVGVAAVSSARTNRAQRQAIESQQNAPEEVVVGAATPAADDVATQIEQLAALQASGAITEAEFAAKKKQLLGI